jgi:hypothetical protein
MTATYTWDVFMTLDGYGAYGPDGDWGGYWGKQGPELLGHRASLFDTEQRMVFGATTFRENAEILLRSDDPHRLHEWNVRTLRMPATSTSSCSTPACSTVTSRCSSTAPPAANRPERPAARRHPSDGRVTGKLGL